MSMLKVQNLPGPGGVGRAILAWSMDVVEAHCIADDSVGLPSEKRVIVAGTGRCALHYAADEPCLFAERMPPECPHPVVTRPDADDLVRCLTCGADSVPVPERWRRFITVGPATPQEVDETLDIEVDDADHSARTTPDVLL
jgi:hypothetical protein